MEFAFTEDQIAITQAAREMLIDTCTPADLRKMLTTGQARDEARWATIKEMGLLGLMAPESAGGLGMGLTDFVGVAEAAGYVGLPEPLVEHAGIAVPLLAALGENDRLVEAIDGHTVALGYPGRAFVADADTAVALLLSDGDTLHLLETAAVELSRQKSIDPFRRLYSVDWTPSAATRRDGGWSDIMDRGAVLAAAQLIGLAQRSIDLAVAYAKERTQFGKPIGSYQAVKHLIATAQVKIEFARPVVYAAAAELALGTLPAKARVSHAKIAAGDAADLATRTAVQVHGAMGVTWEVDLHFFLKRAQALRFDWGTPAQHRARVMERMLNAPTGPDQSFASEVAA
ncbi:acyl-CoA dehydrogenase family protein [Sphingobium tyrosinilyticum]|uniref:Acyl-CoA dehydrogenase family protein n=1 Tax=Sphingobium tyrosinilyticum TaxID=2715436 RepID=A0ABV9F3M7_9SPHN